MQPRCSPALRSSLLHTPIPAQGQLVGQRPPQQALHNQGIVDCTGRRSELSTATYLCHAQSTRALATAALAERLPTDVHARLSGCALLKVGLPAAWRRTCAGRYGGGISSRRGAGAAAAGEGAVAVRQAGRQQHPARIAAGHLLTCMLCGVLAAQGPLLRMLPECGAAERLGRRERIRGEYQRCAGEVVRRRCVPALAARELRRRRGEDLATQVTRQ